MKHTARCLSVCRIRHTVDSDVFGCFHRDESLIRLAVAHADGLHLRLSVFVILDGAVGIIGNGTDATFTGNKRNAAAVIFDLDTSQSVAASGIFIGHDDIFRCGNHKITAGRRGFHGQIIVSDIIDVHADTDGTKITVRRKICRNRFLCRPDGGIRTGSDVEALRRNRRTVGHAVDNVSERRKRHIARRFDGRNGEIFIARGIAGFRTTLDVDMTRACADRLALDFSDGEFPFGRIRLDANREFFSDDEIFTAVVFILDSDGRCIRFGNGFQVFEAFARISEILGINRLLRLTVETRIGFHIDSDVVSFDIRCFIRCRGKGIGRRIDDAVFNRVEQCFFVPLLVICNFFFAFFFGLSVISIDRFLFLGNHRSSGRAAAQKTHRAPFFEKRTFIGCRKLAIRKRIDDTAVCDIKRHIAIRRIDCPNAHIARRLRKCDVLRRLCIDTRGKRIAVDRHLPRVHISRNAAIRARQIDTFGRNGRTA